MVTALKLRTTHSQKCAALPRRARIQGSYTFASLNSRLESNKKKKKIPPFAAACGHVCALGGPLFLSEALFFSIEAPFFSSEAPLFS